MHGDVAMAKLRLLISSCKEIDSLIALSKMAHHFLLTLRFAFSNDVWICGGPKLVDTLIWSLFEHKIFFIIPYREKFSIMTRKPLSCIYPSLTLFMGQNSGYMRFIGLPIQNLSQYMPHFSKRKFQSPCSFSDVGFFISPKEIFYSSNILFWNEV